MMKHLLLNTALMGLLIGPSISFAQDSSSAPSAEAPALSPVAAALSQFPLLRGTLNKEADYYIYLYSAGWCGPCRRIMPQIVQYYNDTLSKNKRIEMVLIDVDFSEKEARDYISHYNADFPAILGGSPEIDKLPGAYAVRAIPHCIAVDKNGNRVFGGHAATLFRNIELLK
ncbi:MAG: thioredoxin family protein [Akkermansia sp.]|nr:thioredoxin family protein [Akkermansia sp.]